MQSICPNQHNATKLIPHYFKKDTSKSCASSSPFLLSIFATMFILFGSFLTTQAHAEMTDQQKLSYTLGYYLGERSSDLVDDLNLNAYDLGFRTGYSDKTPKFSHNAMKQALIDYQRKKEQQNQQALQTLLDNNLKKQQAFLAKNKHKAGVKTTASGLQYKVLKAGQGKSPSINQTVTVHYIGKLMDGSVFDSSYQRGKPIELGLSNVIEGWVEGLQLMNKGAKYQLFIPSEMAYGSNDSNGIEPNSLLIFTVELIDFK